MFKEGQIFQDGEVREVLNSENLSSLFNIKVELINNKEGYLII